MISHAGMPEAFSSGTVKVMGMVIRVVFIGLVKNVCSERRVTRRGEGCKSVEGDHWCLPVWAIPGNRPEDLQAQNPHGIPASAGMTGV